MKMVVYRLNLYCMMSALVFVEAEYWDERNLLRIILELNKDTDDNLGVFHDSVIGDIHGSNNAFEEERDEYNREIETPIVETTYSHDQTRSNDNAGNNWLMIHHNRRKKLKHRINDMQVKNECENCTVTKKKKKLTDLGWN